MALEAEAVIQSPGRSGVVDAKPHILTRGIVALRYMLTPPRRGTHHKAGGGFLSTQKQSVG